MRPRRWMGSRTLRLAYARTHWLTTSTVYASQAACSNVAAVGQHHGERGDRREATRDRDAGEDAVGQQRPFGVARRPRHEVRLGRFALERNRRRQVDEQLHPQDLEREQDLSLGDEDRGDQDEAQERDVGRQQEHEALLDVVDDPAALGQAEHQGRERVVAEDEIGRFLRDGGAAAHRHGHVGTVERRRVVDAIAGDGHDPVVGPRRRHEPSFLVGRRAGDDVEASAARWRAGRRPRPRALRRSRCGRRPDRPRRRSSPQSGDGRPSRPRPGCPPVARLPSRCRCPGGWDPRTRPGPPAATDRRRAADRGRRGVRRRTPRPR